MNNAKIYLCKADCSLLGTITGIQTDTCNLVRNAVDLWELTFDVSRYVEENGGLVQSNYYDSIDDMMKLYIDSDDVQAFFVIDSEPVVKGDHFQEIKTVTSHSIECELNSIYLKNLKINCGTPDSQEYLAKDDDDNYYNINDYTGLPYEYISLVNYKDEQLSLLHLALQGTGWTVKDNIDLDICEIKKSFDTSDSVYSFLMKTVSPAASVIFEFDRKNKQVGMIKAEDFGEDTGVFITMRNLMNSFEVTSSSNDNIITKLVPSGANGLGIEFVNFGKDYILNLDYFMNTLNEYGDYKFVSAELHDKYSLWKKYRESEQVPCDYISSDKTFTRRELYSELTRLYNKAELDISELTNRLPNDGCNIDYRTYKLDELEASHTAYTNALYALITSYKKEYDVTSIGEGPDYIPEPQTAVNIKNTPYWYDYYAYNEIIIPKIEDAIKNYNGENVTDIDSYLYEWSLYGLDELESKKKAWSEAANILFNECFILRGTTSNPISYRTPNEDDETGWYSLTDEQKSEFTTKEAFINRLSQYLDYMSIDDLDINGITHRKDKGIIRQCEDVINERIKEISDIKEKQDKYDSLRKSLADSVNIEDLEKCKINFTKEELAIISSMIREQEYNNDNILITNLDDIVSKVDAEERLYQAASEKLYEISQPQYSFKTELDNLYFLEEFESYQKPFNIGNFIRVGTEIHEEIYDNQFIKLRLISISHNPLETSENLSVEFSTMTKSLNAISDLAFLLDNELSSSGGGSSLSSSSGGTYGNNDANVQISNNMLNALLSTEMFGTAVTDVILDNIKANRGNFNSLFAHSGAFDLLEAGELKISGDCLVDNIKSHNFIEPPENTTNGRGSRFRLDNGTFESYTSGGNYIINDGQALKIKMNNFQIDEEGNADFAGNITGSSGIIDGVFSGKIIGSINIIPPTVCCVTNNYFLNIHIKYLKNLNGGQIKFRFIYYKSDNVEYHSEYEGFLSEIPAEWNSNITIAKFSYTEINNGLNEDIFIKRVDIIDNDNFEIVSIELVDSNGIIIEHYDNNVINGNFINKLFINTETALINSDKLSIDFNNGSISGDELSLSTHVNIEDLCVNKSITFPELYAGAIGEDDGYNKIVTVFNNEGISHTSGKSSCLLTNSFAPYKNDCIKKSTSPVVIDFRDECDVSIIIKEPSSHGADYTTGDFYCTTKDAVMRNFLNSEGMCGDIHYFDDDKNETVNYCNWYYGEFIKCTKAYEEQSFSGLSRRTLYVGSDGTISAASSSRRYKQDISSELDEHFNPHNIYNLPVCQFRYNKESGGGDNSELHIGFIAEDVAKYYPAAARWNKDHTEVDTWEMSDIFPAVVKLIQEQHKEIELLKEEVTLLKQTILNNNDKNTLEKAPE